MSQSSLGGMNPPIRVNLASSTTTTMNPNTNTNTPTTPATTTTRITTTIHATPSINHKPALPYINPLHGVGNRGGLSAITHMTPIHSSGTPSTFAPLLTPSSTVSAPIDPFFGRALTPLEQSYVREFSTWSVGRIEKEPRLLQNESAALQREIEELSLKNYPTFLATNRLLKQADKSLQAIDQHMADLHSTILPSLSSSCTSFLDRSSHLMQQAASHRNMLKHQNFLLELLEIPSLMDTCFKSATAPTTSEREKNKLINGALQLDQYVKELIQQQTRMEQQAQLQQNWNQSQQQQQQQQSSPNTATTSPLASSNSTASILKDFHSSPTNPVPSILLSIQSEMSLLKRNIVNHLLTQLQGNIAATTEEEDIDTSANGNATPSKPTLITIPEVVVGIRIVGLLKRTMEMFGTGSEIGGEEHSHILLKYQFIQSRNTFFESVLKTLNKPTIAHLVPSLPSPSSSSSSSLASVASSASSSTIPLNLQIFKYLDEFISLHRTHLFNITTLYSALFLDHEDHAAAHSSGHNSELDGGSLVDESHSQQRKQQEDIGIICRWIQNRMERMIQELDTYVNTEQVITKYERLQI